MTRYSHYPEPTPIMPTIRYMTMYSHYIKPTNILPNIELNIPESFQYNWIVVYWILYSCKFEYPII